MYIRKYLSDNQLWEEGLGNSWGLLGSGHGQGPQRCQVIFRQIRSSEPMLLELRLGQQGLRLPAVRLQFGYAEAGKVT